MADTPPSTPTTPEPPAAPTVSAVESLREVRTGFAAAVLVLALILGAVAIWYVWDARALGGSGTEAAETWSEGFKNKHVWPILAWSGLFSLAGIVGAVLLLRGGPQADQPERLARMISLYILVGCAALLFIPIYLVSTRPFAQAINPRFIFAVLALGANLVIGMLLYSDASRSKASRVRLFLMVQGLTLGGLAFLLGINLAAWSYWEDFTSGVGTWLERPGVLAWPVALYLGGLALMFISVQPALPLIRQNQTIRRIVFGVNFCVTVFLLLGVLALPNVLAYTQPMTRFFGRSFDWTKGGVYSISPRMSNYLTELKEPVKVYVLMSRGSPITQDTETLLETCRNLNNKVSMEVVPPTQENRTKLLGFMEKYSISDPNGLLVVVGGEDSGNYTFIKAQDLFEQNAGMGRRESQSYTYKGEAALFNALVSLSEGKMVIYVARGHGELALDEQMPPMAAPKARGSAALGTLRQRLTSRKGVEVRSLSIDRALKKVPDDATLVLIARPTQRFDAEEVQVIRQYLQRSASKPAAKTREKDKKKAAEEVPEEKDKTVTAGKLMLLVDPIIVREGGARHVVPTGLEGLLGEYGVNLGLNRVQSVRLQNPLEVAAIPDPRSTNTIARAFSPDPRQTTLFQFTDVRTVEAVAGRPGARHKVEPILVTLPETWVWVETNFDIDPAEYRNRLIRNREQLSKVVKEDPVSIAVAVSDSSTPPGMPRDAAHAGAGVDTPRMVVFGTASWITDEGLAGRQSAFRMDLFNSCVSWLREQSGGMGSSGGTSDEMNKTRQFYEVNIVQTSFWRLVLLPMALMMMTVIALGTGVWVVRRR
jgi:hypothetical protein